MNNDSGQSEPRRERGAVLPLAALIAGSVALGSSPILVRLSELEPLATAFYRVALAAPAFGLVLLTGKRDPVVSTGPARGSSDLIWLALAGLFFAADLAFLHRSLRYTSVANATLFLNFAPFFLILGRWLLFREAVTTTFLVSLAAALGGVALLVGGYAGLSADRLLGDGMAVLAGGFYGAYLLVISRLDSVRTSVVMAVSTATSALALVAVVAIAGESLIPATAWGWLTLAALALVTHAGGQGLIAYGLRFLPASSSSTTLLIQPVAAAGAAWVIFAERLAPMQLAGGAVVLVAIVACHRTAVRKERRSGTRFCCALPHGRRSARIDPCRSKR